MFLFRSFKAVIAILLLLQALYGSKLFDKRRKNTDNLKNAESLLDLQPSDLRGVLNNKDKLQTYTLWSAHTKNLNVLLDSFEKVINDIERSPEQIMKASYPSLDPIENRKVLLGIYADLLQLKLIVKSIINQPHKFILQIPNMRTLQFSMGYFWRSLTSFYQADPETFKRGFVTKIWGYESPKDELSDALAFEEFLSKCITFLDLNLTYGLGDPILNTFQRDITILFQRIMIGLAFLYSIEERSSYLQSPKETSIETMINLTERHEALVTKSFGLPGEEYISHDVRNINHSNALVAYYIEDNHISFNNVEASIALMAIKSILFEDLKNFQLTGNPSTILCRHLLEVIDKRKNTKSVVTHIIEVASRNFERIDILTYQELPQKFIPKEAIVSEEPLHSITPVHKRKPKPKKFKNKQKKIVERSKRKDVRGIKVKTLKKESRIAFEEDKNIDLVFEEPNDISATNSNAADITAVKYLEVGQACYEFVLYPLLEELNMSYYTWKQLSEACFTPPGFLAMAKLHLTQTQVDVCISIVRDRVSFAHPVGFTANEIQDDLLVLKLQHPDKGDVIDFLRQSLAPETGWNVVAGGTGRSSALNNIEYAAIVSAALRVGQFCRLNIFGQAATSLGLSIEASSMSEIIEAYIMNQSDPKMLYVCQSLIKLRNSYAHRGVSPSEAKEALAYIYGNNDADEMKRFAVLEPVFDHFKEMEGKAQCLY